MNFPRNLFIENAKNDGHSDEYLKNTLEYIDRLSQNKLPVIFSRMHFSQLLGIEYFQLKHIIESRNNYYKFYLIKKKNGGKRRIISPFRPLKKIQNWIKINILDNVDPHIHATGYIKGKSILVNAKIHENNQSILNLDLTNFFETINEKRIYGIFKSLGYHPNLAVDFAKLVTVNMPDESYINLSEEKQKYYTDYYNLKDPVLAQGAPTSPSLSNLICKRLDKRLSSLANKLCIQYSRYADDITFSGENTNLPKIGLLNRIIENEGFSINWEKVGKYSKGQKQMVTGLLIDNKVRIPQKFKKEIYRHLFFCKKFGAYEHFQRIRPDKAYRKEWLLGKIYYVNSIEPEVAKKMFEMVKQIDWEI